jgi:thioredoxin reductase (NADPH)
MRMIETDAVIIGAGPVGLFQAFQLGLQDIRCHIVDALTHVGGQCQELYADKPIYDIPGVPVYSGAELIANLQKQVQPFQPTLHLGQLVSECKPQADGRFALTTNSGTQFLSKTVFIAAGVGAFQPRPLMVEGTSELEGTSIHYGPSFSQDISGKDILVIGQDADAISAALSLANSNKSARTVTLMHRRDVFDASDELVQAMRDAVSSGKLHLQIGQLIALNTKNRVLESVTIATTDGKSIEHPLHHVVAFLGISPKLGPIAQWELAMQRKQLEVNTADFSTSTKGIFAVGDINTYPGKKKLILCGFHEATLAAFGAANIVYPDRNTPLQYTTTSSALHCLLGVSGQT